MKWWLLLAAALTSGCGSPGRPPLPKFAAGEPPYETPADDARIAGVRRADVIYLSLTKSAAAGKQPVWRIVELLQRSGERVTLGWTELPVTQQALLEQWRGQEISTPQLLDRLRAPNRGDWMRHALRPGLGQVALGAPRELLRKIRAGEALIEEEKALLPRGYRPRADAFENFAERVSTSPRLRRYNLERLYRTHLAAEQMIADNIVRFRLDNPEAKLLVFLSNDGMINPREIADYVAQKGSLQQMILDRSGGWPIERPQLLARRRDALLKVVDRSPKTGRHHRRFPAPRLRA